MRTLLLTPGPLTTTDRTKAAMQRDWGSREPDFITLTQRLRTRLLALTNADPATHALIPIQGSGTFAIEAMVQTLVLRTARLLVLANGAYGHRLAAIATRLGRDVVLHESPEDQAIAPDTVAALLAADPSITDVALIHLETTSGLLNPLTAIAACVARAGRRLLIDAIGSLGAVPIPANIAFCALAGSANKGLEGVPGLAFVCADTAHLSACNGNASSLSLDLHDQWRGLQANGQWRFTPPTHVAAALDAALDQLDEEGGIDARHRRYSENARILLTGMRAQGFEPYLPPDIQGPVIATFRVPPGAWFGFDALYTHLHARGVVIYPGKLTAEPSFRIGCIGAVGPVDMRRALTLVTEYVARHRDVHSAAD